MSKHSPQRFEFDAIVIDPEESKTLSQQLEDQVSEAICAGRLPPGEKLPSTRRLSQRLGIARNTVTTAYDQLISEGYLETKVGSGTRVSQQLPEQLLTARAIKVARRRPISTPGLSQRGRKIANFQSWLSPMEPVVHPFRPHVPAIDSFPKDLWRRLSDRRLKSLSSDLWSSVDSLGYPPLRQAIADYLGVSRGVSCNKDQVVVVAGAQQALDFVARLLLDPGDRVWMEDPGYTPGRQVFELAGAEVISVPVDDAGIVVSSGEALCATARLAYVTPSSQWPMGMTMSLRRRLEVLDWAMRNEAWVLEDDYNGEFRYAGRPLPPLCSLNEEAPVIYMGTFSKVLFPSLRLGYLVVPEQLLTGFAAARWLADRHSPPFEQAVLTDFIAEGHFARHLRRMRTLYADRHRALIHALQKHLKGAVEFVQHETGMHLVVKATENITEAELIRAAQVAQIEFHPVAAYSAHPERVSGLVLGFAAFNENQIDSAVRRWSASIRW